MRVEGEGGGEEQAGNAPADPCQYRDSINRFRSVFAGLSRFDFVAKCLERLADPKRFERTTSAFGGQRGRLI